MYKFSKDRVSVSTILDTRRIKSNGRYPVKIQVVYQRVQKYYTTGKDLTPDEWKKLPTTKAREFVDVREQIEASFAIIRDYVKDLTSAGDFTFENLNLRLKGASTADVNTAMRAKYESLEAEERYGNAIIYRTALRCLERFAGKRVSFASITPLWLSKYEAFMRNEGLSQTTISIYLRQLRAVINDAIRLGVVKPAASPFGYAKYEIRSGDSRKLALTLSQIKLIVMYKGTQQMERYRDIWMFIYLCNGINVADLIKLKYSSIQNGELSFIRQKTQRTTKTHKEIRVIVTPMMQQIMDRWGNPPLPNNYIFPVLRGGETAKEQKCKCGSFTSRLNLYTRRLGKELGLGNITTYTARHSFATVLKRSGANIAYISESLGHSSMKTTENYLASFEREEREKNALLLTDFGD